LLGGKTSEQHMCAQHVQDARIATRMPGHMPHGPWGEDGAVTGSSLLQALTDVGQALAIGERA